MTPPSDHAQKKFAPVRPLLNQPALNIQNLPTRIQRGECDVPKFCPPICCSQPSLCSPCCIQKCYCPPCAPSPHSMCCPPPRLPVMVCPPSCSPCMPSPPPPPCCPPPPCPPPSCKLCVPKSGYCGGSRSCCCSGSKKIVCVPRGAQTMEGMNRSQAFRRGTLMKLQDPGFNHRINDQPASYNNCNFYLTEMPKSLNQSFGLSASPYGSDEDECVENDETMEGANELEECASARNEDVCQDESVNFAGGDDQIVQPPVGYPGSKRSSWGAGGFPGLTENCFPGYPFRKGGSRMYQMASRSGRRGTEEGNEGRRKPVSAMSSREYGKDIGPKGNRGHTGYLDQSYLAHENPKNEC